MEETFNEKQKKDYIPIAIAGIVAVVIVIVVTWIFAVKIPRDNAYNEYSETIEVYNRDVDSYNLSVEDYNNVAEQIIALNNELSNLLNDAQNLIDSDDIAYDEEKRIELNNTLKGVYDIKINSPISYEKRETLEEDVSLKKSSASKIKEENTRISNEIVELENLTSQITNEKNNLVIPNYDDSITEITEKYSELEESFDIQKSITNPTQEWVVEKLNKVDNISSISCATEDNDPNNKLGKAGGYTAQIYFSTPLLNTQNLFGSKLIDEGTDAGGSIEIYETMEDAESRNTYLSAFDGSIFDSGKHILLGTMVVRVSSKLTASKQNSFTDEIISAITGITADTNVQDDKQTCYVMEIENFRFTVPDYWVENESEENYYQFYAETGGKVAMFSISDPVDDEGVSLDALYEDNENMVNLIEGWFDGCIVTQNEKFQTDKGIDGMLYYMTFKQSDLAGTGMLFVFPSIKDNRWFYVSVYETNNTDKKYDTDFMEIINSIQETD